MRWLVDECVSARLVGKLRELGHDVTYVVEVVPGADDRDVADWARRDGRLLLTDDRLRNRAASMTVYRPNKSAPEIAGSIRGRAVKSRFVARMERSVMRDR